jgi:hypothetical protein
MPNLVSFLGALYNAVILKGCMVMATTLAANSSGILIRDFSRQELSPCISSAVYDIFNDLIMGRTLSVTI